MAELQNPYETRVFLLPAVGAPSAEVQSPTSPAPEYAFILENESSETYNQNLLLQNLKKQL